MKPKMISDSDALRLFRRQINGVKPFQGQFIAYREALEETSNIRALTGSRNLLALETTHQLADHFKAFQERLRDYDEAQKLISQMAQLKPARTMLEQFEKIQQLAAASYEAVQEHIRDYQQAQEQISQMATLVLEEIERRFRATGEALAAAISPLPDLARFAASLKRAVDVDAYARISSAIGSATFLTDVEFLENESNRSGDDIAQLAETHLVKLVPAAAFESLHRVEFAPLVLLDRALRDPEVMYRMGWRDFEGFVAALIEQLGFEDVVLTRASGDGGCDVLATKRIHGIPIFCAFECKRYARNNAVGPENARALLGTVTHQDTRATKGILVTTSHFTPTARRFILSEPCLDGKDFDGIVGWLEEYGNKRRL